MPGKFTADQCTYLSSRYAEHFTYALDNRGMVFTVVASVVVVYTEVRAYAANIAQINGLEINGMVLLAAVNDAEISVIGILHIKASANN